MQRDLLVRLGPFVLESPNAFPLLWKGVDGCSLLWHRRPPPLHHVLDGAWDLGRQGLGRPECPRLHLWKMQGFGQALRAGIIHTQSAQPHCSLSHPTHQWEVLEGDQPCHHAEGTKDMILAGEEWVAGDERMCLRIIES